MRIYRQDNIAILEDISRNGTILNGDLIKKEKRELRHGDSIEIGISTSTLFLSFGEVYVICIGYCLSLIYCNLHCFL